MKKHKCARCLYTNADLPTTQGTLGEADAKRDVGEKIFNITDRLARTLSLVHCVSNTDVLATELTGGIGTINDVGKKITVELKDILTDLSDIEEKCHALGWFAYPAEQKKGGEQN